MRERGLFVGLLSLMLLATIANAGWEQLEDPPAPLDIGIGAKGYVWITCMVDGTPVIYRWIEGKWTESNHGGVRIDIARNGKPWVIAENGDLYRQRNTQWMQLPGKATDIGCGADGSVWIVGHEEDDYGIYRWSDGRWQMFSGIARRIDVGPSGIPWIVKEDGRIFRYSDERWVHVGNDFLDVGIGADGTCYAVGKNRDSGEYTLKRWTGGKWVDTGKHAIAVSVEKDGRPWIIDQQGHVHRFK